MESQQGSTNPVGGTFFLLVEFHLPGLARRMAQLEQGLAGLARAAPCCAAAAWRRPG